MSIVFPSLCRRPVDLGCRVALLSILIACLAQGAAGPAIAQDEEPPFTWQEGPTKAQIGDVAEIEVPKGYRFTGQKGTQFLMEMMENPTNGSELGLLAPASEEADWFVVFEFSEIGYVKDDERDELDADAILESIRAGSEEGNKERRRRGWATLEIERWEQPPRYNPETNNLEWAVRAVSQGVPIVNYNTRLLGRTGVMEANLVINPDEMQATLPEFRTLLAGYAFQSGQRYAEFRKGDKIAKYGLTALITGGAAAVALKTGLFQKLWKFILVGIAALGVAIKKLFSGGRRTTQSDT